MKKSLILFFACLLSCALASAQSNSAAATAPGSSLPGVAGLPLGMDGPGYVEVGGGYSALSASNPSWNDFYVRGMISGGRNAWTGELTRQSRFGSSGWFYGVGLTRTLSENWYAQVSAGGSAGSQTLASNRMPLTRSASRETT